MNSIIEDLRQKPEAPHFLPLIQHLNPGLTHLFGYFSDSGEEIRKWMEEYFQNLLRNLKNLPAGDCRLLLWKGALKLASKGNPSGYETLVNKLKESLYEEGAFSALSPKAFDPDALPSKEILLHLRKVQLNSAQRLLLDLIFQIDLTPAEAAKALNLSEPLVEAFVFNLFRQWINETDWSCQSGDELTFFLELLRQKDAPEDPKILLLWRKTKRMNQILSLDLMQGLDQEAQFNILKTLFPTFEIPSEWTTTEKEPSLIETIRRRNEQMQAKEEALIREIQTTESIPKPKEESSPLVKPSLAVLCLFGFLVVYKTLNPEAKSKSLNVTETRTVQNLQDLPKPKPLAMYRQSEKEIEAFVPTESWKMRVKFDKNLDAELFKVK